MLALHATNMDNCCQGTVAGVHQHALALEGIQVIYLGGVGTIISLAQLNTVPCMCIVSLSDSE